VASLLFSLVTGAFPSSVRLVSQRMHHNIRGWVFAFSLECGVGIVWTWKRVGLLQVMQVFAGFVSFLSIVREEGGGALLFHHHLL